MKSISARVAALASIFLGVALSIPNLPAQPGEPKGPPAASAGHQPEGPAPTSGTMDAPTVADLVSHLTSRLTLTSAQATQTTALLTQLQTSISAAQSAFSTALKAILTPAQVTLYSASHEPDLGGFLGRPVNANDVAAAVDHLTKLLTLTTAQVAQTTTLLTQLQTALGTAQSAFTTSFEAILTSSQLAIYEDDSKHEGAPPFGTGVDFATNDVKYLTSLLTLTSSQQTVATTAVGQLQTAITAANTAFETTFSAELTSAQLAIYQAGHLIPPDGFLEGVRVTDETSTIALIVKGLNEKLTLTSAQQTQATTTLTQLLSALSSADTAFDTSLEAVLTPAQLAIYKASLQHPDVHGPH